MWDFSQANLSALLKETWPILVIGFGTASLAFLVGWTALRKRKAREADGGAESRAAEGPNERRAASRRGGHPVTVEMNDPDALRPPVHGYVIDRSVGGLCLMVPSETAIGSFWKVRPSDAPRTTPPVRVEVKSCVPVGGEWKLGCQFDKTPSYAILLMFG